MARKKKVEQSMALILRPATLPQNGTRKRRAGQLVSSETRNRFLDAYELFEGNVSRACKAAGINRRTFYRWMDSPTKVNEKFRRKVALIRPDDFKLDQAEETISLAVQSGDVTAAIFTLKTKGRSRGWNERVDTTVTVNSEVLDKVAFAYSLWLADHPHATMEEKMHWLGKFAENGKVDRMALVEKVGLKEK